MSEYPYPDNRGQTHHEGCYRRPHHHNCAVAEIERLEAELADCKESRRLIERLVSWAQNEEMINQYFTDHGKDCNEAVKEIERLECSLKISQEKHRLCIARVEKLEAALKEKK